jgi:hypothetical protein
MVHDRDQHRRVAQRIGPAQAGMTGIEAVVAENLARLHGRLVGRAGTEIGGRKPGDGKPVHQALSRFRLSAGMIG